MRRRDAGPAPHPDEARDLAALDAALAGEANEWSGVVRVARAARPPLRQAFATRLDVQVARGLKPRPARLSGLVRPRRGFAVAGAMASVALAVVIGVGSATHHGSHGDEAGSSAAHGGRRIASSAVARNPTQAAPTGDTGGAAAGAGAGAAASESAARVPTTSASTSTGDPLPATGRPRRVERTTQLALATPADALTRVSDAIVATTDRFGGIVERSDVDVDDHGGGAASFDLRVPDSQLPRALAALSKLAHVRSRSASSLDITAPTTAVSDRLDDAVAERTALLRRLAKASTANATAAIKARLGLVRGRIADLRSQAGALAQRANLATVGVTLTSTGKREAAGAGGTGHRWGPGDAWHDAVRVLSGAAAVGIVSGVLGAPLLLLGAIMLGAGRRSRRRRREAALV